ncbi:MAG: lasso peptide biosynthesis B2 protein [Candidatus Babeliales bacterium]
MIYFSLSLHVYAARFDDAIVVLDSVQDKYFSIVDSAAQYLDDILNDSFEQDQQKRFVSAEKEYDSEQLNYWISYFIEKKLIFIMDDFRANRKLISSAPLLPGGLKDYQWDTKSNWKPFKQASKIEIIKTFFYLAKIHRILKSKGIQGILDEIKKIVSKQKKSNIPCEQEINSLSAAIDAASLLYPKKTYCLAWASTFVFIALKKNWACNLVIGIQTNPFYAHAWAELAGQVIHDDPVIAQVLSIILKEPNK